jgi:serine/threonine protein kinase
MHHKSNGKKKETQYIVLELANGGEVFDFVAISGRFEEPMARYFFKQFLSGLQYCHSQGIAHRDLKPENLLLDNQYNLKIADFGFAGPIAGRDGTGNLTTKLGTMNYMAPEIHLNQPYKGECIDVFSAAIILFIMVAQHPPFTSAIPSDPFYRCLAGKRGDIFWRTHCKSKPDGDKFFSEEFKDLVESMLKLEPAQRPTISDILAHPWMQGPTPDRDSVVAEFKQRNAVVKEQMDAERQSKDAEKMKRMENRKKEAMRSGNACEEEEESKLDISKPQKHMESYEKLFAANTEFFSTYNPDMIEDSFCEQLKKLGVAVKTNDKKYKVKFSMTSKDQSGASLEIKMVMRQL